MNSEVLYLFDQGQSRSSSSCTSTKLCIKQAPQQLFFVGLPPPQYLRRRFRPEQIGGVKDLQSQLHLQISIRVSWGLGENEFRLCHKCGLGV